MRYSLLDSIVCPFTHEPLVVVAAKEVDQEIPPVFMDRASRVGAIDAAVGPLAAGPETPFSRLLLQHASSVSDNSRNTRVVVERGILVSQQSGRWYPIIDEIPEMLPSSLRNWERDLNFLQSIEDRIPKEIRPVLRRFVETADRSAVSGDNFKKAEIVLTDELENKHEFLGPGFLSPFNAGEYHHSHYLIRGFAVSIPLLNLQPGDYVLDSGSGYSWTTEWFMKMGINAIGVEINRDYLKVGKMRMGNLQPHLIIADAENLPFISGRFNAVLGFDAFHHIPSRKTAMKQFARVLKPNGRIVLVEPGADHGPDEYSQEVMKKYGTLEVGMSLKDVRSYISDVPELHSAEQVFPNMISTADKRWFVFKKSLYDRSMIGWCMYVVARA